MNYLPDMARRIYTYGISAVVIAVVAIALLGPKSETPADPSATPQEISSYFDIRPPDGYKLFAPSQDIMTVENAEGKGFQVFVTPFDEAGPISEDRIRQDMPDAEINEPALFALDVEKSFVFYGLDDDIGETFEVWVVHGGKLFQVMGKKADEELIVKVLNTWKWR